MPPPTEDGDGKEENNKMSFKKENDNNRVVIQTPSYMSYNAFYDNEERDYIKYRLFPQIQYYSQASRRMQKEYYILSITNTVFMAAVPLILMLPFAAEYTKTVSASVSAIASVFSNILLITRTKDNWLEYRTTSGALQSELAAFKAKSADYKDHDPSTRFSLFVERCEQIMQAERTGWYSRMKLEASQEYRVRGTSDETGS